MVSLRNVATNKKTNRLGLRPYFCEVRSAYERTCRAVPVPASCPYAEFRKRRLSGRFRRVKHKNEKQKPYSLVSGPARSGTENRGSLVSGNRTARTRNPDTGNCSGATRTDTGRRGRDRRPVALRAAHRLRTDRPSKSSKSPTTA